MRTVGNTSTVSVVCVGAEDAAHVGNQDAAGGVIIV